MQEFHEHGDNLRQPHGHGQRGDLHGQIIGVAIDDQAAQAVAFAEDHAGGPLRIVVAELPAELDGRLQTPPPKGLVQRLGRIPSVKPDADAALAVEDAAGDELALVAQQVDHIPVGGVAFDPIDGRIEHPRVPAVKGTGLARFQDCLVHAMEGRRADGR